MRISRKHSASSWQQSYSLRAIAEKFVREGRTDRTGKRKLGVHVIYTNLQEHFPVLEKMNGGERRTSFGEWAAQHIRKVENPKAEVKLKSIRQFYGDWCKTSGLHPASNRAIFHHLTQQGFESYIDWARFKT